MAEIAQKHFAPGEVSCCNRGDSTCLDCIKASFCGICIQGFILQKAFGPTQSVNPACCSACYPCVPSEACCCLVSLECLCAGSCAKSAFGKRFPFLAEHSSDALSAGILTVAKTRLMGKMPEGKKGGFCSPAYTFLQQIYGPCYCVPCKDAAYLREMRAYEKQANATKLLFGC